LIIHFFICEIFLVLPGSLKICLRIWLYSGILVLTHVIYSISDSTEIFTEPGTEYVESRGKSFY